MPSKVTYGKRKKSILSLFPVFRDDDKSLQSLKTKAGKRASAMISMTTFYGKYNNDSNQQDTLALDDSIEEMTSLLIDDTTMNQLTGELGKRLSQLESAKVLSQSSQRGFSHEKPLPRLLRPSMGGDDDWTPGPPPAITVAGAISNEEDLTNDEDELDSCPPPVPRQPAHARKSSAPPLPRKSSKRSRLREQKEAVESHNTTGDENRQLKSQKLTKMTQPSFKYPIPLFKETAKAAIPKAFPDVSRQIEAMLVASRTLKPEDDSILVDTPVFSKKSVEKRSKVLSKMNAIVGHLHDKGFRKHHDLAQNEHLLDPNLSQLPDYDEEASTISTTELSINEGINLGNPKIQSLTGHGTIRRKPIADDGRSLRSQKSVEVFTIENIRAIGARALTSFDSRRQSNVSFDRSIDIISSLPGRSHRFQDEPRQLPVARKVEPGYKVDFDVPFSSSPVAQSTPRIRLELAFEENGDKKLRNVPADLHSQFNPDSSMREPLSDLGTNTAPPQNTTPRKVIVKRNNSQDEDVGLGVKPHMLKRRKKHPSPSKAELEGLEDILDHYSPRLVSMGTNTQEELTLSFEELRTGDILKFKNNNAPPSQTARRGKTGNRLGLSGKPKQAVAGTSMAEPARRPTTKMQKPSMIPKPAGAPTVKRRTEPRKFQRPIQTDESAMDTDELQWDLTAYHIGVRV